MPFADTALVVLILTSLVLAALARITGQTIIELLRDIRDFIRESQKVDE